MLSSIIKKISSSTSIKHTLLLIAASIFGCLLLSCRWQIQGLSPELEFNLSAARFFYGEDVPMLFLVWNLFLAWIPFIAAVLIAPIYKWTQSKIIVLFLLISWLFFFPNAPYIITDFVHLKPRIGLPFWYDIMMISTFAGTGLMLGLLSLLKVEKFIASISSNRIAKIFSLVNIPLCGFGIWIGRYQRWNSWDVVTRPDAVILDIYYQIKDPITNMDTLGLSIVITIMILFSYLFLQSFPQTEK